MSDLKWSYNEFLAFLLIYIAHVDMEFAEEEKAMIKTKFGEDIYVFENDLELQLLKQ